MNLDAALVIALIGSALAISGMLAIRYAVRRARRTLPPPPPAPPTPQQRKLMGLDTPGDQKFQVPARDWNALRITIWRSKVAWDIATRAAADVVDRCRHADGCPGKTSETEPCLRGCPDREVRMSALVVLGAAHQLAPVNARRPADQPFFAPSRERYGEVMAELAAAQAELEVLRAGADRKVLDAIEASLRTAPQGEAPTPHKDTYIDLLVDNDVEENATEDEGAEEGENT